VESDDFKGEDGQRRWMRDWEGIDDFADLLVKWKRDNATPGVLPFHINKRIWTRFFFSIKKVDESLHRRNQYLGAIIHRYIVCFLNAVLVEEIHDRATTTTKINFNNPINSDRELVNNLNNEYDKEKHLMTRFFITCPIFHLYVRPSARHIIKHASNGNKLPPAVGLQFRGISFKNLYHPLCSVLIQREALKEVVPIQKKEPDRVEPGTGQKFVQNIIQMIIADFVLKIINSADEQPILEPKVPFKGSITEDNIACFICGKHRKRLSYHVKREHKIDFKEYRRLFDLEPNYPETITRAKKLQGKEFWAKYSNDGSTE
jgi:hypothetical protein